MSFFMATACPAGMVWNETALAVTKTCNSTDGWFWSVTRRIPRCDCTHGTVLHEGKCIPQTQCPGKGIYDLLYGH